MADEQATDSTNTEQPVFNGLDAALDHVLSKQSEDSGAAATEENVDEDSKEETLDDEVTEEEETETDDSEEESEEQSEEEEESDEEESEDTEEDDFFEVEDGDEVIKVSKEEAKAGYLRNKAFTQKTQALASERKEVETERTSLLETKAEYVKALDDLKLATSEQLKGFLGVDWVALQRDDPVEFEEKQQELEAAKLAYAQVNETLDSQKGQLTKEAMDYAQKVRQEEMSKLAEFEPDFMAEGSTLPQEIRKLGVEKYGFAEDELSGIYDHRMIRVLADALKFQNQSAKLERGNEKVKTKSIKPKGSVSKSTAKARAAKARKATISKPDGLSMDEAMRTLFPE